MEEVHPEEDLGLALHQVMALVGAVVEGHVEEVEAMAPVVRQVVA